MTVRFRLALTVLLTGIFTAVSVVATMILAFQRFEHENAYLRADAFLGRVLMAYDDLLDLHQLKPTDFAPFLRNLLLFEPDSQLYLLAADGTVLAHTGQARLAAGFRVALGPVQQSAAAAVDPAARRAAPYVMGDDPERMETDAVVAARALKRSVIRSAEPVAGYLYLVTRRRGLPGDSTAMFGSTLAGPALLAVAALIVVATLLAVWIIGTVTRPLRVLSQEVAAAQRQGFSTSTTLAAPLDGGDDEFAQLRRGFRAMLATLREQWDALQRMDQFRRESVSNLSHDLRSPLTATVACLETLEQRWAGDDSRGEDARLVHVALRNTRNAASMVRSLGDLALLDEPAFRLKRVRLDLVEMLDDISARFAQRAAQAGVGLHFQHPQLADAGPESAAVVATVDVELVERALANLLDNALRFTPAGGSVTLGVAHGPGPADRVQVIVADTGAGIAAADLPHLFDRFYQSRASVAPATGEGGKGLGLAIVKRIVELHGGVVAVASRPGEGTRVTIELPPHRALAVPDRPGKP